MRVKLGQFVRRTRFALGLNQSELAERLGISHPTISAIENGHRTILLGDVARWARALDVERAELARLIIQRQVDQFQLPYRIEVRETTPC